MSRCLRSPAVTALAFIALCVAGAQAGEGEVLCLGDSHGKGWIEALRPLLPGRRLHDAATSGMSIGFDNGGAERNLLKRLDGIVHPLLDAKAPISHVVVLLGSNDCKAMFADRQDEVPANLQRLCERLAAYPWPRGRPALIYAMPPPCTAAADKVEKYRGGQQRVAALVPRLREVCTRLGVRVVDTYAALLPRIEEVSVDGLHLNPAGSALIAETLAPALRDGAGR